MPITKRKCRVCGKEYEACRTTKNASGGFNWREVACSPECGERYLCSVMEARGTVPGVVKAEPVRTGRKNKNKSVKRHERPTPVEDHVVTTDAVVDEAPVVPADTAYDTVAEEANDASPIAEADFE